MKAWPGANGTKRSKTSSLSKLSNFNFSRIKMKNFNFSQTLAAFAFCLVLALFGCTERIYRKALADAAQPTHTERSFSLTKISSENPNLQWKEIGGERYVLVSSWKADAKYYKNDPQTGFYNTGKYPIWVTAAPDLQQRIASEQRKFNKTKPLDKRLKQLFGLPPNADKKVFVEFWVRPQDLVRPCVDSEVTDGTCDLALPTAIRRRRR